VLAGSLPQGVSPAIYRQVIERLDGKKVILDSSGEALRLGVCARPWLIKPNTFELHELVGWPVETPAAILSAARGLMEQHAIASVVVSMGAEGAIFIDQAEAVWAVPPAVEVRSTVGAGDALVAGITAASLGGLSLAGGARLATAFAACAVSRVGAGLPAAEVVRALAEQVKLRRVE
jgi:1-phosphofructokinase